jgi:predicted ATP-dependent serine protease
METEKAKLPTITDTEIVQAISELKKIRQKGLRSTMPGIDNLIGGSWQDGIVISGKPGEGKTIFALNLAVGFTISGNRVIYLDLENDRRHIIKRIVLILFSILKGNLGPTEGELLKNLGLLTETENLSLLNIHLKPYFSLLTSSMNNDSITPRWLEYWAKLAKEEIKETGKQAILIIDSINELASVYPLAGNLYESLEKWLAHIKLLRVTFQMPIVLLCHVPKASDDSVFNPKGSSGIAHFARTQIIVERQTAIRMKISIVRSQFGGTGEKYFDFDQMRLGLKEHVEYQ